MLDMGQHKGGVGGEGAQHLGGGTVSNTLLSKKKKKKKLKTRKAYCSVN